MAYTQFDTANPDGSQTGSAFATSTLADLLALRDGIIAGRIVPGWTLTVTVGTGTQESPQYRIWSDGGTRRLRMTPTYNGDGFRVDSVAWDYSTNSGGLYEAMGSAEGFTFDGSLNITASTNSGWLPVWLHELWAKFKNLRGSYLVHVASATAHGIGTIAAQAASAVAITGGTIAGVVLSYTTARGKTVDLGNITGTVNIDWSAGDFFYGTVTGIATLTWTNVPTGTAPNPAGALTLELTNPGAFTLTWPTGVKWPGALAPSRTVAGVDLYEFVARNSIVRGAQAQKASA
jgi:hypothetical protein